MQGEVSINGGKLSLAYNPRCLKRDLSSYTASTWLTIGNLLNLTIGPASASVYTFQNELQGRFTDGFLGLHAGGHFTIGGDAGDIFSSPVDPAFWLHHAMLDHVWWLWQALHLNQASTVAGTITLFNNPPSRNTTLDDALNMGVNAPTVAIRDVLNTLGGTPLCYIYL
jgi:tyrosinase